MANPTKAELIVMIDDLNISIDALETDLQTANQENRNYQRELGAAQAKAKKALDQLAAASNAIVQELAVNHRAELSPNVEWFRGELVPDEKETTTVRFLRHLHGVLSE